MGTSSTPDRNAELSLRGGRQLTPPRTLPFRAVARTHSCGALLTTPDHLIRKDAGEIPKCHACEIRTVRTYQRKREKLDAEYRRKQRRRVDKARARQNGESLARATRARQQWTGPELEIVARDDLTAVQVADMLGRSYYAVKHARRKLTDPKWEPIAGIPQT